jgi:outer membrane protein assembly factor BamB
VLATACALGTLAWAVPAGAAPAVRQVSGPVTWGQFLGDAGHTGTSPTDIPPPLEVVWSFDDPFSTSGLSTPLVVHAAATDGGEAVEGDVVVAVGRTRVYLLDAATGEVRATVIRQDSRVTEPAVADVDGRPLLLFVQGEGEATSLVAVDLSMVTPAQAWTFPLGDDSLSGVTVAGADGDVALVGDRQGEVHAVTLAEVAEGESRELWTREVGGNPGAAIAGDDSLAYVPVIDTETGRSRVVALDLSDGRPRWTFEAPAAGTNFGTTLTSTAVDDHQVVVGFPDRTVRSVDPRSGVERSTGVVRGLLLTTPTTIRSTPILSDGDIYLEDIISGVSDFLPSALYRIDGDTGERVWDFQFDASPSRSAPLVSGEVVYIGLGDGRVAAVDREAGDLVWEGDTGNAPVLGLAAAGDLIVAATGGRSGGLVALRHVDGPLVRVQSPTRLDTGTMLANLGIGFLVAVVGLFLLFGVILRRFGPRRFRDDGAPTGETADQTAALPPGDDGAAAPEADVQGDAVDRGDDGESFEQVDGDDGETLEGGDGDDGALGTVEVDEDGGGLDGSETDPRGGGR